MPTLRDITLQLTVAEQLCGTTLVDVLFARAGKLVADDAVREDALRRLRHHLVPAFQIAVVEHVLEGYTEDILHRLSQDLADDTISSAVRDVLRASFSLGKYPIREKLLQVVLCHGGTVWTYAQLSTLVEEVFTFRD